MSANQYDDDLIIELDDDIEENQETEQDSDIEASADTEQPAKKPSRAEKRISELTWKAKTAEERAALLEQELAELKQSQAEVSKAKTNERLAELKKQYAEALEYGDNEKAAELNEEMLDIKLELREQSKKTPQQPQRTPEQEIQQQEPQGYQPTDAHLQFERENADWLSELRRDPEQVKKADEILGRLHTHGFRADDPKMWALLKKNMTKQARPSAEVSNGVTSSKNLMLSESEKAEMRNYGLDPTNKNVVAEWKRQKGGK